MKAKHVIRPLKPMNPVVHTNAVLLIEMWDHGTAGIKRNSHNAIFQTLGNRNNAQNLTEARNAIKYLRRRYWPETIPGTCFF